MPDNLILDPRWFSPDSFDQEIAEFNESIHKILSELPPTYTQTPQALRDARERGEGLWPMRRLEEVEDRSIPGPAGDIPLRVYVPNRVRGVYLHIHGGGFMFGRPYQYDEPCVRIAKACQVVSISVDYRLAPEHPFPAGLDDCEASALWAIRHMKAEFGVDLILIGGESAGANLSVATLLRMRDRHGYMDFAGANLIYGVYLLSGTPSCRIWGEERKLILTSRTMEWFNENYAPRKQWDNPEASPLFADLKSLPPALFTIGTMDPLLDDSLFMSSRWTAAGNKAVLAVYPGGIHAFNLFPSGLAEKANDRMADFIRGIVDFEIGPSADLENRKGDSIESS
ncbi:MAG: alpha/beta hydrolase [Deltaproteobacteria bacterium]|nr:alpha/beta hydrolase [Deltaproteobacteria bacterium]